MSQNNNLFQPYTQGQWGVLWQILWGGFFSPDGEAERAVGRKKPPSQNLPQNPHRPCVCHWKLSPQVLNCDGFMRRNIGEHHQQYIPILPRFQKHLYWCWSHTGILWCNHSVTSSQILCYLYIFTLSPVSLSNSFTFILVLISLILDLIMALSKRWNVAFLDF